MIFHLIPKIVGHANRIRFLILLLSHTVVLFGQRTIALDPVSDLFGGNETITPALIQQSEAHIYVDGRDKITMFNRDGDKLATHQLDSGWIANFTVIERSPLVDSGKDLLVVSTVMEVEEFGSVAYLDYRMLFFSCDETSIHYKGVGYDPNIPNPRQAYFRNLYVLPDGRLIANIWNRNYKSALFLQEVLFNKTDGADYADDNSTAQKGFEIGYLGTRPLFRRFVPPGSPLASDKSVVVSGTENGRIFISYALQNVVHILDPDSQGDYALNRIKLSLADFKMPKGSIDQPGVHLPKGHSLIRGLYATSNGSYMVAYEPDSEDRSAYFQKTQSNWQVPLNTGLQRKTASKIFVGFYDGQKYFHRLENGHHYLDMEPID